MAAVVAQSKEYGVIRETLYKVRHRMTVEQISAWLRLPIPVIRENLEQLIADGKVIRTEGPEEGFMHEFWARRLLPKRQP